MIQETSLWSYRQVLDSGMIGRRQKQVYEIVAKAYPSAIIGSEVARIFHEQYGKTAASETVRNRLTELRDKGVIECVGVEQDTRTKMIVMNWRLVVGARPRKIEKKETSRQKIKRLEARILFLESELARRGGNNNDELPLYNEDQYDR